MMLMLIDMSRSGRDTKIQHVDVPSGDGRGRCHVPKSGAQRRANRAEEPVTQPWLTQTLGAHDQGVGHHRSAKFLTSEAIQNKKEESQKK